MNRMPAALVEIDGAAGPEAEGARRATAASGPAVPSRATDPDPEVPEKVQRRRFTAEYRRRIVKEADACKAGELGALLRREGLYASHLRTWRRQREQGELAAGRGRKRGPVAKVLPLMRNRVNLDRPALELREPIYVVERRAFCASSASRLRYDSPSIEMISA